MKRKEIPSGSGPGPRAGNGKSTTPNASRSSKPSGIGTRRRALGMLTVGTALLVLLAAWSAVIVPSLYEAASPEQRTGDGGPGFGGSDDGEGLAPGEDLALLEGRIGFMSLIGSLIEGDDGERSFDLLNLTLEDFDLSWTEFEVTGEGFIDRVTGEPVFDAAQEGGGTDALAGFQGPDLVIGPERRDYSVRNVILNDTVLARFAGETVVEERTANVYEVSIEGAPLDMDALSATGLFGPAIPGPSSEEGLDGGTTDAGSTSMGPTGMSGAMPGSFLGGGSEMRYDEHSIYYIDVGTSIPLDLEMDLVVSMVFPDASLMMVTEGEEVSTTFGEVWLPHPTAPGAYQAIDVTIESHLVTSLLGSDETVAVFESWVVYIDNSTGEPIDDKYQPQREVYAVDRETSMYVAGLGNSERTGLHGFPIGRAEPRTYPLWDAMAGEVVDAEFVGEEMIGDRRVHIYEQVSEDVVIDSPNMILPVYRHPALDYKYDGTSRYTIDAETGMFLDIAVETTVVLASSGPLGAVAYPVTSFSFSMDDEFVEMMIGISSLFEEVLLPLSNEVVPAFAMELGFTDEMTSALVEVAILVETVDGVLNLWVPLAILASASTLLAVGTLRLRRIRARGTARTHVESVRSRVAPVDEQDRPAPKGI